MIDYRAYFYFFLVERVVLMWFLYDWKRWECSLGCLSYRNPLCFSWVFLSEICISERIYLFEHSRTKQQGSVHCSNPFWPSVQPKVLFMLFSGLSSCKFLEIPRACPWHMAAYVSTLWFLLGTNASSLCAVKPSMPPYALHIICFMRWCNSHLGLQLFLVFIKNKVLLVYLLVLAQYHPIQTKIFSWLLLSGCDYILHIFWIENYHSSKKSLNLTCLSKLCWRLHVWLIYLESRAFILGTITSFPGKCLLARIGIIYWINTCSCVTADIYLFV